MCHFLGLCGSQEITEFLASLIKEVTIYNPETFPACSEDIKGLCRQFEKNSIINSAKSSVQEKHRQW